MEKYCKIVLIQAGTGSGLKSAGPGLLRLHH